MTERFAIDLPAGLSTAQEADFVAAIGQLEEVSAARALGARSTGSDAISIAVQLVTQLGGPVLQAIAEIARSRQIRGVEILLPNGTKIAVDQISGKDLRQILAMAGEQ
jgi:hypothetical protein